jgi:heme exporter protein D
MGCRVNQYSLNQTLKLFNIFMSEFFNMGGYAVYVWSSFGISFVVLLLNVIFPVLRRKQLLRDVEGHIKRRRLKPSDS